MSNSNREPSPLPFRIDPRFGLHVTGQFETGGVLEFRFENRTVDVWPAPAREWGIAALLTGAGQQSQSQGWFTAFKTVKKLAGLLSHPTRLGLVRGDEVVRLVYDLRLILGRTLARKLHPPPIPSTAHWGLRLLETHPTLGYRISLPPQNLKLTLIEDSTPPQG